MNINYKNEQIDFSEDSFDLLEHRKAAIEVSRYKARQKRSKRSVFVGKILLAFASLGVFAFLLIFAMRVLGLVFAHFPGGLNV